MRRLSALDHMVQNFQHNWETNPQFRAAWSGGLGIAIVVMLCACLGVAFTFSSTLAASITGSTTASSPSDVVVPNGTPKAGGVDNTLSFPTQTPGPATSAQVPQAQLIPPSLTPQPSPTAQPTATPLPTTPPGAGGNGNGGGGGCGNCSVTVTSVSLTKGSTGSVTIHTSNPNAQVNVFVKGSWTSPQNTGSTDGNGDGTISLGTVPGSCTTVSLWIVSNNSGSTTYNTSCS